MADTIFVTTSIQFPTHPLRTNPISTPLHSQSFLFTHLSRVEHAHLRRWWGGGAQKIWSSFHVYFCLFVWVLWHINLCRLFSAKSIFYEPAVLFQTIQFSISTQINCQKRFHFKLFSLVKQFHLKCLRSVGILRRDIETWRSLLSPKPQFKLVKKFAENEKKF